MKMRAEWLAKMALGFICYHAIVTLRCPLYSFVLGWAGFYAYCDDYAEWAECLAGRKERGMG